MKKMMLLGVLMLSAAAGYAQESRQDVSFSGTWFFAPQINAPGGIQANSTGSLGLLASYRFMLTPHSALELNYGFAQNQQKYKVSFNGANGQRIHSRAAGGHGGLCVQPELQAVQPVSAGRRRHHVLYADSWTTRRRPWTPRRTTGIGGLFGGGLAYELSPSFDLRLEYRGFVSKAPDYGVGDFKTNIYQVFSMPAFGVAYHF